MRHRVEPDFYTPLGAAVTELGRRRSDRALCRAVDDFMSDPPIPFLDERPRAILLRALFSPDRECARFAELAQLSGLAPLCLEIHRDRFVSFNTDKYGRGKMTFVWPGRRRALRIIDFDRHDGHPFDQIDTVAGTSLVDFHHRLFAHVYPALTATLQDSSDWLLRASLRPPRYRHILGLALTYGILFENFAVNDPEERRFYVERVLPSYRHIRAELGLRPLIVELRDEANAECESWNEYAGELYSVACGLLGRCRRMPLAPSDSSPST